MPQDNRKLHPDTIRATVTLRGDGAPKSFTKSFGRFELNKSREIGVPSDIEKCLGASVLRVQQFNAAGEKVADSDSESSSQTLKPRSVKRFPKPDELPNAPSAADIATAEEAHAAAEKRWLEEQQRAAAAAESAKSEEPFTGEEIMADVFTPPGDWSPAMSKAALSDILAKATGKPVDETLTKAKIVLALESLETE